MHEKLHVVHSPEDSTLVEQVTDFLEVAFPTCQITRSNSTGHRGEATRDLTDAAAVVAILSKSALLAATVPFELGMARCLGKPAILIVDDTADATRLWLPLSAEHVALAESRGSLIAVGRRLAATLGVRFGLDHPDGVQTLTPPPQHTSEELLDRFSSRNTGRSFQSRQADVANDSLLAATPTPEDRSHRSRAISEVAHRKERRDTRRVRPVKPTKSSSPPANYADDEITSVAQRPWDSAPPTTLHTPSRLNPLPTMAPAAQPQALLCFEAGRGMASCLLQRTGHPLPAAQVSRPFAELLFALGMPHTDLQHPTAPSLWSQWARTHLQDRCPTTALAWYELGYQITALFELAAQPDPLDPRPVPEARWVEAMRTILEHTQTLQWSQADVAVLEGMVENLRGHSTQPQPVPFDATQAERIWAVVQHLASRADELQKQ